MILEWIDANHKPFDELALIHWNNLEFAYKEYEAVHLQMDFLKARGHRHPKGGHGHRLYGRIGFPGPAIGVLGEYDALGCQHRYRQHHDGAVFAKFHFTSRSPEAGRSALDAVKLMGQLSPGTHGGSEQAALCHHQRRLGAKHRSRRGRGLVLRAFAE